MSERIALEDWDRENGLKGERGGECFHCLQLLLKCITKLQCVNLF